MLLDVLTRQIPWPGDLDLYVALQWLTHFESTFDISWIIRPTTIKPCKVLLLNVLTGQIPWPGDLDLYFGCSAEDIAIRGNGTGLEYMCPTRHFVYIFFNPVFQLTTAKNEINLFNNHILIVASMTFAPAGATTPSAEFMLWWNKKNYPRTVTKYSYLTISLMTQLLSRYVFLLLHENIHFGYSEKLLILISLPVLKYRKSYCTTPGVCGGGLCV